VIVQFLQHPLADVVVVEGGHRAVRVCRCLGARSIARGFPCQG